PLAKETAEEPAEAEEPAVVTEPVLEEIIPAEVVGDEPVPEITEPPEPPTADDETEVSAGVTPDPSSEEEKPAPFSWGPPAGKTEEAVTEAEPAPEEAPSEPAELRHPRHIKPNQTELDGDFSLLIVNGGTSRGVEPADVIELVTTKSDLTGSDVRRVRVLSRYTLMQVPSDKAASVAGAIDGAQLRGETVAADAVVTETS
ncbi:MAG: DbpA RNA binding domain-containing protein, partial [Solirubrobacterales bacterium]